MFFPNGYHPVNVSVGTEAFINSNNDDRMTISYHGEGMHKESTGLNKSNPSRVVLSKKQLQSNPNLILNRSG